MLNKPKYMIPSTNLSECVIDANAENVFFSCIVDGNESISAWQIKVYTLNDCGVILDTGKRILETPFFPVDNKNRNIVFNKNIKEFMSSDVTYYPATSIYDKNKSYYKREENEDGSYIYKASKWTSDYSLLFYEGGLKNAVYPYYWTIAFWSTKEKDNDHPTTTSCGEVFYSNSAVISTITYGVEKIDKNGSVDIEYSDSPFEVGTVLDSNKLYFKANYDQAEGIELKRYGWRIKDFNNNNVLIDTITQNQIYGISDNIVCSYDGFLNEGEYSVELYIETQNNAVILTEPIRFSVFYEVTFLTNDFKVSAINKESSIALDWGETKNIGGRKVGDIKYLTNYPIVSYSISTEMNDETGELEEKTIETGTSSVVIPEGSSIVFDYSGSSNLDIPEDSYIVLSLQLYDSSDRLLFSSEGYDDNGYEIMRRLSFDGEYFVYSVIDSSGVIQTIKSDKTYTPNVYKWYVITMYPTESTSGVSQLRVVESNAVGGLTPSSTLKPSTKIKPSFGRWDLIKEEGENDGV